MSTFPPNYDYKHWTLHSDLFILIIKTMVKTPVFYLQFTPAPCFFHANTQFLRRFGLRGFLCRLSKGPEVFPGGSWGIFATSFESKNGEYWFGKGTWLSQISFWMWREIAMRFMNVWESLIEIRSVWYPFCCCCATTKSEETWGFTGSDCHHVIKNRDRQRCWCIA